MARTLAAMVLAAASAIFVVAVLAPSGSTPDPARQARSLVVADVQRRPDPNAPPGAAVSWLPRDDWVQQRWLPYSEDALYRVLQTDRESVRRWLRRRPLEGLAQRRHLGVDRVVRTLLKPWQGRVSPAQLATLREHATRTFTQRHLMQHMLFHTFHVQSLSRVLPSIFGQTSGYSTSLADQARANGRDLGNVQQSIEAVLASTAERGVRLKAMPAAEARAQAAEARAAVAGQLQYKRDLAGQPRDP